MGEGFKFLGLSVALHNVLLLVRFAALLPFPLGKHRSTSAQVILLALLLKLVLLLEAVLELRTLANVLFDQNVEVSVISQRLLAVLFAEEPRVVAQVQALPLVVLAQTVLFDSLTQVVGDLVLADLKLQMQLRQGEFKIVRFQLINEVKEFITIHARFRVSI